MSEESATGVRGARLLTIAFGLAFALYLFLQPGNLIDEGEHLHAAWLIAVRGRRPIHDFFEHHTPLLWQVLGLGFRAGVRGPEMLYVARVLIIVCAAVWCWTLVSLARRWSDERGARPPLAGAFAVASFAVSAIVQQDLIVTRPETIALALFGGALLVWTGSSRSVLRAAASGFLLGLSALASPRFALLTPLLLITSAQGRPAFPGWARSLAGTAGALLALVLFVALWCPPQDLLFDLSFSSLLQQVSKPGFVEIRYIVMSLLVTVLLAGVLAVIGQPSRIGLYWWVGLGMFEWGLCVITAGSYLYSQAVAPALAWLGLFVAWLEASPRVEAAKQHRQLALLVLASCTALSGVMLWLWSATKIDVFSITESRQMLLGAIPRGERVLIDTAYHPIAVEDASYWGSMLISDPPGRGCETGELYNTRHPDAQFKLPKCDFVSDLRRNRPFAAYRKLPFAAQPEQYETVERELERGWALSDRLDSAPMLSFAGNVLFRK